MSSKGRRRKYRYSCGSKARYATRTEALAEQPSQVAYLCSSCGCWHLTMSWGGNNGPDGARA